MVTGTGPGAAMEKCTPVRSMRVDGPGAARSSMFSMNTAATIESSMRKTVPVARAARHTPGGAMASGSFGGEGDVEEVPDRGEDKL